MYGVMTIAGRRALAPGWYTLEEEVWRWWPRGARSLAEAQRLDRLTWPPGLAKALGL